jgi:hypothetical protein
LLAIVSVIGRKSCLVHISGATHFAVRPDGRPEFWCWLRALFPLNESYIFAGPAPPKTPDKEGSREVFPFASFAHSGAAFFLSFFWF